MSGPGPDSGGPDAATRAQIAAANPAGSVWLAANAGSGKTRVLTDRVAWLLLEGTPPERILCLTYTKAAAGEMQNRLFRRLGSWAMLPDEALRSEITRLGAARGTIDTARLRLARTLFARAIETPGGLKIQTIHAFCAALLRRFPLEAGVSPAFSEMDEIAAARLQADVFDEMALDPATRGLVDGIARTLSDGDPGAFLARVAAHRGTFPPAMTEDELRAALGIHDASPEAVRETFLSGDGIDLLETVIEAITGLSGKIMHRLCADLAGVAAAPPAARFDLLTPVLLTQAGQPRSIRWSKDAKARIPEETLEEVAAMAADLCDAHARIRAFAAIEPTRALLAFAPVFIERVEARKRARGWLDFDDQIAGARRLLTTSSMAQWVLFKLDGGLDHILVDEAQDTSPAQWDVITSLAAEFGAGHGARPDVARTVFVVGDRKQSIYAFQGADLNAFDRIREDFARMLPPGGPALRDHALLHSFRSSPVILDLVDAVFTEPGGLGDAPEHIAFHPEMPGRVDLWPVVEAEPENGDGRNWYDPVDRPARNDVNVVLAERIARSIERMIADKVPVGRGADRRPVQPGDILILLQRRRELFHHIVSACKARGLDLAGADRLHLSGDLAVRDLIAVLTWAATPSDDLSLACVLRSPLGNLDEAGLFDVARGRKGRLWDSLRDAGVVPEARAMLDDILVHADYERPYELLQRILIAHDGRRRLLARLGAERAEAIDALLSQALGYEQLEVPSLTGFLGWLASADVEIKRQGGRGSIRVMSVHGAKGLESPVVILPETMKRRARQLSGVQRLEGGLPVWMPPKANRAPAQSAAGDAAERAEAEERDRLLYVAMTRAESWLIVGAAGDVGSDPGDSWYRRIESGLRAQGASPQTFDGEEGLRLETGDWSPAEAEAPQPAEPQRPLPDWAEAAAPPPPRPEPRIAPSALPGAKALPGEHGLDSDAAMRRGTAIHALLEHLPGLPRGDWEGRAGPIVRAAVDLPAGMVVADLLAEARAVLDAPGLAHVFAPETLAEVPFALPARGPRPAIFGTIDRLILTPDAVTVVDFKTNAIRPSRPAETPAGLLAQMNAYREAAEAIWPGRAIRTAILWTGDATLMELPHDLVTRAGSAIDAVGGAA